MKMSMILAAGLLTLGTAAFAAESGPNTQNTTGNAVGRMQGSPNAAGFGKGETTGSTVTAPGGETKSDGKMQGSPNAAGFKGGQGTSGTTGR